MQKAASPQALFHCVLCVLCAKPLSFSPRLRANKSIRRRARTLRQRKSRTGWWPARGCLTRQAWLENPRMRMAGQRTLLRTDRLGPGSRSGDGQGSQVPVSQQGIPCISALGDRRGLLVFRYARTLPPSPFTGSVCAGHRAGEEEQSASPTPAPVAGCWIAPTGRLVTDMVHNVKEFASSGSRRRWSGHWGEGVTGRGFDNGRCPESGSGRSRFHRQS